MRVLFVDDDAMNRAVVRAMLGVAEVDVAEASSAPEGLAFLDAEAYELILMDLRMPGMDGLEATRAIRARADAKAATPVVIVTADMSPDLKTTCLAAGANDFLTKPIIMDELFDIMARVLIQAQSGV